MMLQNRQAREKILRALFPRGINRERVWNDLVVAFRKAGAQNTRLNVEGLEEILERRFGLRKRISRRFPTAHGQMDIIAAGDMDLLHKATKNIWEFAYSHEPYAQHTIVLHGMSWQETLLDWAAQAVIVMLLVEVKATHQLSD